MPKRHRGLKKEFMLISLLTLLVSRSGLKSNKEVVQGHMSASYQNSTSIKNELYKEGRERKRKKRLENKLGTRSRESGRGRKGGGLQL